MNPLLMKLLSRYMAPAGDDGADTGGAGSGGDDNDDVDGGADRGDDFTPTEDDDKDAEKTKGAGGDDKDVDPDNPDADPDAEDDKEKTKKDDKAKPRDQRIPLSRHKDLLEKERAKRADLERQLAQFQRGKEVAAVNEDITKAEDKILELEKEYAKLISDGEPSKAAEVMSKIRRMERDVVEQKAEMKIAAAEARATEAARYNIVLERVEAAYPELNEDHEDYDEEVVQDVLDLKAAYESRRRMPPSAALQAAVTKLLGKKTSSQKEAVDVTPRVPKDEGKKTDKQEETAAERKKKAVEKALDADKRTPPNASKVGVDSDKIGGALTAQVAMKLPEDEFNKLDERTLARMRGDEL
jgi:hypothetical protein